MAALRRTALIALPVNTPKGSESREQVLARADLLVDQARRSPAANRYLEANRQLDAALLLLLQDASTGSPATPSCTTCASPTARRNSISSSNASAASNGWCRSRCWSSVRPPRPASWSTGTWPRPRELRQRGESQFARDPLAAIKDVTDGTDALRRALQAAGLSVPQTMSSTP